MAGTLGTACLMHDKTSIYAYIPVIVPVYSYSRETVGAEGLPGVLRREGV